ncbi:MAG: metallopeptidase TldD-related protein [Bacteroidia bacterium]|nr:metallopeptidase TldD-related protein [Bacteroidia bacterium]
MKTIIRIFTILAISVLICHPVLKAQTNADDIIFKAMNDELNRSISKLTLDKHQPPFFISFQLSDAQYLSVRATLGTLLYSSVDPSRSQNVRLMVGDYSLNDENFVSGSQSSSIGGGYLSLPLDNNYDAIRRSFWIASDQSYKRAIESYDQKLSALKQQNKSDEEKLDDYSKITPVSLIMKSTPVKYDKAKWEAVAKDVSGVFKAYTQISNSSVFLASINASVYVTTNEGTKLKVPFSIACLWINANSQAEDGETLNDQLLYYALTPEQLPAADKIKQDIKQMADNILALSKAPAIKDAYSGPVIFEGEAVAELCAQKLFKGNGLIASREPIFAVERPNQGSVNKMDDKINQKICSENITIKDTPKLKTFNNIPLIGSFEIDAEGVVPKDELVLIDKGFLKTMLNDRVPTNKIKVSNGHRRFLLGTANSQKAPGVINISYNNGEPSKLLQKAVLKEAEKNGLEFIYVIRKLEVSNPGQTRSLLSMMGGRNLAVSKPIGVYKVMVKTGEEQLVRSAVISEFPINKFKEITLGSKEQIVYNTLLNSSVPVSFIVPQALVFNDISIEKDKNTKPKLPIVSNPLLSQK